MFLYFCKKLSWALFSLFCVASATFFLLKVIPGDPFVEEKAVSKNVKQALLAHYDLDKPIWQQYVKYMINLCKLDLGPSLKYPDKNVNQIIAEGFPVSAIIGLESILLSLVFGVLIGVYAGASRSSGYAKAVSVVAAVVISLPGFVKASLLQYVFAIKLGLLPVARWGTFKHTILPVMSISVLPAAHIARLVMTSMHSVMSEDFIRAAMARGINRQSIIFNHALRCAIFPVFAFLGPLSAAVLCGTFVVEKVFGIPGMGSWWIKSVGNRDYFVITGLAIFYSSLLLFCNLLVDLAYAYFDPRMDVVVDNKVDGPDGEE